MTEKEIENKMEQRKAEILYILCENDKIYHPQLISDLVSEVRAITKIIKLLKENGRKN